MKSTEPRSRTDAAAARRPARGPGAGEARLADARGGGQIELADDGQPTHPPVRCAAGRPARRPLVSPRLAHDCGAATIVHECARTEGDAPRSSCVRPKPENRRATHNEAVTDPTGTAACCGTPSGRNPPPDLRPPGAGSDGEPPTYPPARRPAAWCRSEQQGVRPNSDPVQVLTFRRLCPPRKGFHRVAHIPHSAVITPARSLHSRS